MDQSVVRLKATAQRTANMLYPIGVVIMCAYGITLIRAISGPDSDMKMPGIVAYGLQMLFVPLFVWLLAVQLGRAARAVNTSTSSPVTSASQS